MTLTYCGGSSVLRRVLIVQVAILLACAPTAEAAKAFTESAGPIVLEVSGKTKDGVKSILDMDSFEALGLEKMSTTTPWTEGKVEFSGISGKRFVEALGVRGSTAIAVALNDYSVEIPLSDFTGRDLLIASRMNGKPLSRRDKGPFWIVYPFDQVRAELMQPLTDRSIWQLRSIRFE